MTPRALSPDWLPWGPDAFDRARVTGRPILLTLGATWSLGCIEMHRTTYRDPRVLDLVDRHFVPVWVDTDDRPDIGDRYSLGAWPTTAFLTADGRLLGGQTFTAPARMTKLLEQVTEAYCARRDELASSDSVAPNPSPTAVRPRPVHGLDPTLEPWVVAHLQEAYDGTYGGFGRAAKRLQRAPVLLALARCHAGDTTLRAIATHTLDAVGWSPLFDDVSGGMFRCAARRDWTEPAVEKLLTVNAAAAEVFLEGWVVFGETRYRERALEVIRYVREALVDPTEAGFFSSQQADDVFYTANAHDRAKLRRPPVDQTVYTEPNAVMARVFIRAADTLHDASLLEFAVDVLERIGADAYRPGHGVAHRVGGVGGGVHVARGLLADHVALGEALLDAYAATDREVYLDMAQEVMLYAMRVLWDRRVGVFVDREVGADDVGLLRQTITPFTLNCRAAALLARLHRVNRRPDFAERASAALAAQAASARAHSVEAAVYALAGRELCVSGSS